MTDGFLGDAHHWSGDDDRDLGALGETIDQWQADQNLLKARQLERDAEEWERRQQQARDGKA